MRIKPGVDLNGVHFMLWWAAAVFDYLHRAYGFGEATITGGREKEDNVGPARVRGTLHPGGLALDFRFHAIPLVQRGAFARELARLLGPSFDVVVESDHYHVEYLLVT